jgi:hypothetical protein
MKRQLLALCMFTLVAGGGAAQGASLILPPRHSTLTLFAEAGLFGDSHVRTLSPANEKEATSQVLVGALQSAGLERRVSSARLRCGQRDSDVYLFDNGLFGGLAAAWRGNVVQLSCKAGQTATVNLHQVRGQPGNVAFGDRATSAFMLVHAAKRQTVPLFSTVLAAKWEDQIETMLPSAASADGGPELTLVDVNEFHLKQNLIIDGGLFCTEGSGWFRLRVRVFAPASGFGRAEFVVQSGAHNASGGGLLCSDRYKRGVRDGARSAATRLEDALNADVQTNSAFREARTFYFSAQAHGHQFFVEFDGLGAPEPQPPVKPLARSPLRATPRA